MNAENDKTPWYGGWSLGSVLGAVASTVAAAAILWLFSMNSTITRLEERVNQLTSNQVNGQALQNSVSNNASSIAKLQEIEKDFLVQVQSSATSLNHIQSDALMLRAKTEDMAKTIAAQGERIAKIEGEAK